MTHTEELVFNVNKVLRVSNDPNVSILDTVFNQNSTAPVGTAAHQLCSHSALSPTRLRVQRSEGVLNIVTAREFWALDRDKVLVFAGASFEREPIDIVIPLVFVTFHVVPTKDKMLSDIVYTVTNQAHGNVMPWHSAILCLADLIALPVLHALEVHDTVVVEFLAGEDIVVEVGRMAIGQWMLVGVPSSETQINTTDESQCIINDDEFFVVSLIKVNTVSKEAL